MYPKGGNPDLTMSMMMSVDEDGGGGVRGQSQGEIELPV